MLEHLLHGDWRDLLAEEMSKDYFHALERDLAREVSSREISPDMKDIFRAFNLCQYKDTRIVIVGQDPYINSGQSDGLAFSVKPGIHITPTLLNIFKALQKDLGCYIPNNGSLEPWARQGVLLMNSILTTRIGQSRSHQFLGWETFTNEVIKLLNEKDHVVFMLWGKVARLKLRYIDRNMHLVLVDNHPSPIIACNTFVDTKCFSTASMYLYETTPDGIDWQIPNI